MFSQWKIIKMGKEEDSCCLNGENKLIDISATKQGGWESGKQTRHNKYRLIQQKQYILIFLAVYTT